MMTKICTDVEQSNKLIELGIDVNTADMCYHFIEINKTPLCVPWERVHDDEKDNSLPAWSLAALLGVLPILERKGYQKAKPQLLYNVAINKWIVNSHVYTTDTYDNPIDACVSMIEKLHELNLL